VETVVEDYLKEYVTPKLRSARDVENALRANILPAWGSWRVSDVTRRDVRDLLRAITDRGSPQMANRVLGILGALWTWALDRDLAEASPVAGMKRPHERPQRTRFLAEDEIRRVWAGLDAALLDPAMRNVIKAVLVTGQRPGEVSGMDWAEVSRELTGLWWTVPEARAKNRQAHRVPLSALAFSLMGAPKDLPESGPVFESLRKPGHSIHRDAMNSVFYRDWSKWHLRVAARPHDLRRTVETGLASLKTPREVVARVLGHTLPGITGVYLRHSYDQEARDALNRWADHLQAVLAAGMHRDKVVSLPTH
jgi:integrase